MLFRLLLRPCLFLIPAEAAHKVGFLAWRLCMSLPGISRLIRRVTILSHPALQVQVLGLDFPNPVGLAAGFDKNAIGYEALGKMGFGFVEIGTVTPLPQAGNPKPRLFRVPEHHALINCLGFNNDGAQTIASRLRGARHVIVGVNLGKNKNTPEERAVDDYVTGTRTLAPHADYLVINVSSPNTPGLRDLQAVAQLRPLLKAVRAAADAAVPHKHLPVLIKIAPDLTEEQIDQLADLALELGIDGIIATNTTVQREGLSETLSMHATELGGLSGAPLKQRALHVLRRLKQRVGDKVVLVSCGGIETPNDALDRLAAGASLIQVYTGLVYQGPTLPRSINRAIIASKNHP